MYFKDREEFATNFDEFLYICDVCGGSIDSRVERDGLGFIVSWRCRSNYCIQSPRFHYATNPRLRDEESVEARLQHARKR
jgi:hypothetical protein